MPFENTNFTAMGFLSLEREYHKMQKELGVASHVVMTVRPCNAQFLAKLVKYLEDDRYVSLQRHELKKELYLREMRNKQK